MEDKKLAAEQSAIHTQTQASCGSLTASVFHQKMGHFYDWSAQIKAGKRPMVVKNANVNIDLITTDDAARAIVEVIYAETNHG